MSEGTADGRSFGTVLANLMAAIRPHGRRLSSLFAALVTVAMLVGLARALLASGLEGLAQRLPDNPFFYVAVIGVYQIPQAFDYLIFRRLWGLPLAGFAALTKKRIANDIVLGYSGDAFFYAWARGHAGKISAPFGAIKDVGILSGIAGNVVTLLALPLALPFAHRLLTAAQYNLVLWSVGVTVVAIVPFLLFGHRVFTLSRGLLGWILAMLCSRVVVGVVATGLLWHLASPDVSIAAWLVLSMARLLVSRLPLLPNNDVIFANIVILVVGHRSDVAAAVAVTSAAILLMHPLAMLVLALVPRVAGARR